MGKMDQAPLYFGMPTNTTIEGKGEKIVIIHTSGCKKQLLLYVKFNIYGGITLVLQPLDVSVNMSHVLRPVTSLPPTPHETFELWHIYHIMSRLPICHVTFFPFHVLK
jgi:hypothetical protein